MRPDTWHLFVNPNIWRFFGEGLLNTIMLSLAAIAISFVLALFLALGRLSTRRWISWPCIFFIEVTRALPVLLLIVYFYIRGSSLFEPIFGEDFDLPSFWAGVMGLSMYTSAVLAEIIRAGILSLPRGQREAAAALGLDYRQSLGFVILPQALRLMVPAMVGQLTTIIKDTSLVGIIGVSELLKQGKTIFSQYFNPIEVFLIIAVIYFVICFTLSQLSRRLEIRAPKEARIRLEEIALRDGAA